jgi:hypothetical protein
MFLLRRCDVKNGKLFDIYVETTLTNSAREPVGKMWTLRSSGHCQTDLAMAQALTHDLAQFGVAWQIRDAEGTVVEHSENKS